MKRYLPFLLLTLITTSKPTPVSEGQDHVIVDTLPPPTNKELTNEIKKIETVNDSLNDIKKDLFKEALKNQALISKKKPAKIVKIKPVPVPVPVPITVYVKPEILEAEADTSLANDYLKVYSPQKPVKKRKFFYRLFHHKKRKK